MRRPDPVTLGRVCRLLARSARCSMRRSLLPRALVGRERPGCDGACQELRTCGVGRKTEINMYKVGTRINHCWRLFLKSPIAALISRASSRTSLVDCLLDGTSSLIAKRLIGPC